MRASAFIGGDWAFNNGESTPQNASSSTVLDSLRLMVGKVANEETAERERERERQNMEGIA